MQNNTIDALISKFDKLKEEEKEFTMDLLKKIFAESRRNSITLRASSATRNLKAGKVKRGSVNDLFKDLEND